MPDGSKGRDHGRGVVVITSSIASLHNATNVDMMSYATTKAATDHLASLLAAKFSKWYVRVCGINPGCKYVVLSLHNDQGDADLESCPEQHESYGHRFWSRYLWRFGTEGAGEESGGIG